MCGFSLVDDVSDEPRSVVGIPDSLDPPVGKIDPVESCEDVKISKLSGNIFFLGHGTNVVNKFQPKWSTLREFTLICYYQKFDLQTLSFNEEQLHYSEMFYDIDSCSSKLW